MLHARALGLVFTFCLVAEGLLAAGDQPPVGFRNRSLGLRNIRTETITLSQAIEMALRNNLDVRWNRTDVKLDADRVRLAWGAFDPNLNLSMSRESIRTPQNAQQIVATGAGDNLFRLQQIRLEQELIFQQQVTQAIISGQAPPLRPAFLDQPLASTVTDTPIFEEENFRLQSSLEGRSPWGTRYTFGVRADRLDNTLDRQIPPSVFHPEWTSFAGQRTPVFRRKLTMKEACKPFSPSGMAF